MTTAEDRARLLLAGFEALANTYAGGSTGTERLAASAVAGLLQGVRTLLEHRDPEEVRLLLIKMANAPLAHIDTVADDAAIDALIERKPEDPE